MHSKCYRTPKALPVQHRREVISYLNSKNAAAPKVSILAHTLVSNLFDELGHTFGNDTSILVGS